VLENLLFETAVPIHQGAKLRFVRASRHVPDNFAESPESLDRSFHSLNLVPLL
jgi:hypothetical protein